MTLEPPKFETLDDFESYIASKGPLTRSEVANLVSALVRMVKDRDHIISFHENTIDYLQSEVAIANGRGS